ncbi:MAG: 3'-5' exonuclease [Bacteroidales bacterium]|nr:3'-5' exonuclease [Bacteroidales bacterium]
MNKINIDRILFLDIETVPIYSDYNQLDEKFKALWDKKSSYLLKNEEDTPEKLYKKAGIYAEFGKIVCISVGFFRDNVFRIKSFYSEDENQLLSDFINLLEKYYSFKQHLLCAHNGKEFDFPYLARRILINGLKLPEILDNAGKKPWEVAHLDTLELWKFGDYKNYTSLELLAAVFDIPTPKNDIDGSEVADVFWKDNDLQRIATYCQKDVLTIAQLFLRYQGKPLISRENVIIVE